MKFYNEFFFILLFAHLTCESLLATVPFSANIITVTFKTGRIVVAFEEIDFND